MNTIYKYELKQTDRQTLKLPVGAVPLHVGVQHERIYVWAHVDTEELGTSNWQVRIAGTGHGLATTKHASFYKGTVMLRDGDLVFHVFMRDVETFGKGSEDYD